MTYVSQPGDYTGEILNERYTSKYPDACPIDKCEIFNKGCANADLSHQTPYEDRICGSGDIGNPGNNMVTHTGKTFD